MKNHETLQTEEKKLVETFSKTSYVSPRTNHFKNSLSHSQEMLIAIETVSLPNNVDCIDKLRHSATKMRRTLPGKYVFVQSAARVQSQLFCKLHIKVLKVSSFIPMKWRFDWCKFTLQLVYLI